MGAAQSIQLLFLGHRMGSLCHVAVHDARLDAAAINHGKQLEPNVCTPGSISP